VPRLAMGQRVRKSVRQTLSHREASLKRPAPVKKSPLKGLLSDGQDPKGLPSVAGLALTKTLQNGDLTKTYP
jgi:hypothetical protein